MKSFEVKVDFGQLLEDIEYTNMVTKTFDVSDIITKGRYYELKDSLVKWLLRHNFTENTLNGLEYTTGKVGERIELVTLAIRYGDKECLIHQNLDMKICEMFGLHDAKEEDFEKYVYSEYDVEFDEMRFREAISRMKTNRIRFIRESMNNNGFEHSLACNNRSTNPWMRPYLVFLPLEGKVPVRITDKNEQKQ